MTQMNVACTLLGIYLAIVPSSSVAQTRGTDLIFQGTYSTATYYSAGDVVTYLGASYVALRSVKGVAPSGNSSSSIDWSVMAQAGAAGPQGVTGPLGFPGPVGAIGPQGFPGIVGATGPQGAVGPAGPQGVAGSQGPIGPQGFTGVTGAQGLPGVAGATGAPGLPGAQGPAGQAGPQGLVGLQGLTGPQGVAGTQGLGGAVGPQGPSGPSGPQGAPGVDGLNKVGFLAGKLFSVQGDSIAAIFGNQWQKVVLQRTGMYQVSQDARPARKFADALECYGNPPVGGTPGVFDPTFVMPNGYPCSTFTYGWTSGNTLAQNMAGVDVLIVDLGTNDNGVTPVGQLGDSTTAGTYFGNMRWVLESYTKANPAMHILLVTPQYMNAIPNATTLQYVNAIVAYGNSVGIPVLNMFSQGGANAVNYQTLMRDNVHPSDFGFASFYGPAIAQTLQQIF